MFHIRIWWVCLFPSATNSLVICCSWSDIWYLVCLLTPLPVRPSGLCSLKTPADHLGHCVVFEFPLLINIASFFLGFWIWISPDDSVCSFTAPRLFTSFLCKKLVYDLWSVINEADSWNTKSLSSFDSLFAVRDSLLLLVSGWFSTITAKIHKDKVIYTFLNFRFM